MSTVTHFASGSPKTLSFESKEAAIAFARSILAALDEPVETKPEPDRSELDKIDVARWLVFGDGRIINSFTAGADIERPISYAKNLHYSAGVYELVAHVAEPPPPVERKVVRL